MVTGSGRDIFPMTMTNMTGRSVIASQDACPPIGRARGDSVIWVMEVAHFGSAGRDDLETPTPESRHRREVDRERGFPGPLQMGFREAGPVCF